MLGLLFILATLLVAHSSALLSIKPALLTYREQYAGNAIIGDSGASALGDVGLSL